MFDKQIFPIYSGGYYHNHYRKFRVFLYSSKLIIVIVNMVYIQYNINVQWRVN